MKLDTTYLGLELPHPFIAGSSPMADSVSKARQIEDVGAAAIVMRSLFQEQLDEEAMATHYAFEQHADSYGEATSYLPDHEDFVLGPDEYLDQVAALKSALSIPLIASLNGTSTGGWMDYARLVEQAGADALELNLYDVVTDIQATAARIEDEAVEMVRAMKGHVAIPVAIKLSPFYTSLPHVAARMADAGADGLVLFNRFFGPDIDFEELELRPRLELSTSSELPLRLRWLSILSGQLNVSLAVSGGVHTVKDVLKSVMCGAHAVQMVSAVLKNGPHYIARMCSTVSEWLEDEDYESLRQMQGSLGLDRCPNPEALSRANYMQLLRTWVSD